MIIRDNPSLVYQGARKAILINPPVYDTQYWAYWSQPHGLLKVATWLRSKRYTDLRLIDCMATDYQRRVPKRTLRLVQRDDITKRVYHFGMTLEELKRHLRETPFQPDEIWITSLMTYWWESTRDVIRVVKEVYAENTPRVLVGGIYPTLYPEHAEENLGKGMDIQVDVVDGEICNDAANAWTDLSLYDDPIYTAKPHYALVTGSRGCPFNCAYCAQLKLNHDDRRVKSRSPEDIVDEIEYKYRNFGVREVAFYEDNLLFNRDEFMGRLSEIQRRGLKITIYAPEGIEPRLVEYELMSEMRRAGFRKLHLALETIDNNVARGWNRRQATIEKFETAIQVARKAGWTLGTQDLNAFVIFGIPDEDLQSAVNTALYASQKVGSVVPMLFTPVPGSILFDQHKDYLFGQQSDGTAWDLQDLNGKLLPFLEYNRQKYPWLRASDYRNLEKLMMHLNRSKVARLPFNFAQTNVVANSFRAVVRQGALKAKEIRQQGSLKAAPLAGDTLFQARLM